MATEIKGEKLKQKLIDEIKNLTSLNESTEECIKRQKESKFYELRKKEVDEWEEGIKKSIEKTNCLIFIMKNQLLRDFEYEYK